MVLNDKRINKNIFFSRDKQVLKNFLIQAVQKMFHFLSYNIYFKQNLIKYF